ncbi:exo-alpha-sialidase [Streptomyces polygonati]|uniref:exo-alpha-sialidase n=1 Tax=Streptomyces polygonati TaxID=1617087 RepID=A0ABV8HXG3_9ACTN
MPARRTAALAAALLLTSLAVTAAAPHPTARPAKDLVCETTLWAPNTFGNTAYRIPAVVRTGSTLVAFAEARRNSPSDSGDISVVERRSTDGGCTWTPQQTVADYGNGVIGNEVPLVTAAGGLALITDSQAGAVTQDDIQAGTVSAADGRRVWIQASADAGATWSPRREITSQVKLPDWRWFATGPGHGITVQYGAALGRFVVAADHTGETRNDRGIEAMISDDSGRTWRIGALDDHSAADDPVRPDETTAAELLDGRIYLSSRNVDGSLQDPPLGRGYTYSLSDGSTFSAPSRPMPGLVAPEAEGSVLQDPGLPAGVSCHPLLYSGPEDPAVRQHLTIRRSDDGGITWYDIAEITAPDGPAAYSDIVKVDRTHLGIAYETWDGPGQPARIAWTTITLGCP